MYVYSTSTAVPNSCREYLVVRLSRNQRSIVRWAGYLYRRLNSCLVDPHLPTHLFAFMGRVTRGDRFACRRVCNLPPYPSRDRNKYFSVPCCMPSWYPKGSTKYLLLSRFVLRPSVWRVLNRWSTSRYLSAVIKIQKIFVF